MELDYNGIALKAKKIKVLLEAPNELLKFAKRVDEMTEKNWEVMFVSSGLSGEPTVNDYVMSKEDFLEEIDEKRLKEHDTSEEWSGGCLQKVRFTALSKQGVRIDLEARDWLGLYRQLPEFLKKVDSFSLPGSW